MSAEADARRTALVTGASSGIGAAIAHALAARRWSVAIGARRIERLRQVGDRVEAAGGRVFAHALDVTSAQSIADFFAAAQAALGPIDTVVSNAGSGIPGRLEQLEVDDIRSEIATNLVGPILVARQALPSMLAHGRGDLVFITSANAVTARTFQVGYTASKAGLEGAVRALRMDLEGTGVRATIVRPGPTLSEFGSAWEPARLEELLESWKERGLLRHGAILPADSVAAAVVTAVSAPPGTHLDEIQVNPEVPKATEGR